MIRVNNDNRHLFIDSIDKAKRDMIPMMGFVEQDFHDFDQYKGVESSILLRHEVGDESCVIHLYHLNPGDMTLRSTLILPSSWDKRVDIIRQTIPKLLEWFEGYDQADKLLIQSLEYGEVEIFPTLAAYIVPILLDHGFDPTYRMYMKLDQEVDLEVELEGIDLVTYQDVDKDPLMAFYYQGPAHDKHRYFTNCTKDEVLETLDCPDFRKYGRLAKDKTGQIVGATMISLDEKTVWIDNFTVDEAYDQTGLSKMLLAETLKTIRRDYTEKDIVIYLNRNCAQARQACEANGMKAYEFWVDLFYTKA